MSRQLRIARPGAFYHIYSRGNQKQAIFLSDEDRFYFLKTLGDANETFGVRICTYCLMPNHYHLFAETPWGGLSKAMHLINTTYTVYFNMKHARVGHLFQGRFKSILVEASTYARELSRYIHLNPVRAGIVSRPEDYPWSSYQDYLGIRRPAVWLETSSVLGNSGSPSLKDRECYAQFILAGIGIPPPPEYDEAKRSGILGSSLFRDRIKAESLGEQVVLPDRERPQLRYYRTRRSIVDIISQIECELGPRNRHAKAMVVLVSQKAMGYALGDIASFFGMSISGISTCRRRLQSEMGRNDTLVDAYERIVRSLNEGTVTSPAHTVKSDDE